MTGTGTVEGEKHRSWDVVLGACLLVVVAAVIAQVATDSLNGTSDEFFAVCAQVAPVFALAIFVEIAVVMTPVFQEQGTTPANRALMRTLVRANVGLFLLSEGAALYAVGSGTASTFLVVCSVAPWALQMALMADTAYTRAGLSRIRKG